MTKLKDPLAFERPGAFEETRYEKLHSVVFDNPVEGSKTVANSIADLIRKKQKENKNQKRAIAHKKQIKIPIFYFLSYFKGHILKSLNQRKKLK